jgi:hypothetical protein
MLWEEVACSDLRVGRFNFGVDYSGTHGSKFENLSETFALVLISVNIQPKEGEV